MARSSGVQHRTSRTTQQPPRSRRQGCGAVGRDAVRHALPSHARYTEAMEYFREGDRVRTRVAKYGLPAGATGTIRHVFLATPDSYDVAFDGVRQPVMMYRGELEPAENEHAAGA
jgi:hypothetical protein